MKVGIFIADSNGGYPVPAAKGGAVSTLVEHIVELNNEKQLVNLNIISIYDVEAKKIALKYPNIEFTWVKPPQIIKWLDEMLFFFVRIFFPRKKSVSYKTIFSLLFYIIKAARILKKEKFDKVVLENNIPLAWSIKLSNYMGDYYYHFHNVPRINAKCKDVFEDCKAILCVSQFVADQIASTDNPIGPIAKERLKVLYNCIDTQLFHKMDSEEKGELRKKYNLSEQQKIVIFVGRLSEEKGIDKLLEAVKQIKHNNITVLIAGSYIHNINIKDSYQVRLYELAKELGDKVYFTGYIPQMEIPEIYNVADIAVLPSMWDEPAGLTMVEAMACGLPVITTVSGGIPEYVGDCGILLQRDDDLVQRISANLDILLEMDEDYKKYEIDGPKRVNDNFCLQNYLESFIEAIS